MPLRAAAEQALANFKDAQLETVVPLDLPFTSIDGTTSATDRNAYITLERVLKFGATPSCRACKFEGGKHTPACRARFNPLVRADKISKPSKAPPSVSGDASHPPKSSDPAPSLPAPHTSDPPPDVGASASQGSGGSEDIEPGMIARIRDDIDEAFIMQDRAMNCARRLATVAEHPGHNTLFEYVYNPESNLSGAAKAIGVDAIRLSHDTIDLLNKQHIEQLHGQIDQLKGADLWFSLPCSPQCQLQSMSVYKVMQSIRSVSEPNINALSLCLHSRCPFFRPSFEIMGELRLSGPDIPSFGSYHCGNNLSSVMGSRECTLMDAR